MYRNELYVMSKLFSKEEMEEMEDIIDRFSSFYKISLEAPVDIFKIANKIGFDVRGVEFPDFLEGMLLVDENQDKIGIFDSNKVIGYNCRKDIMHKKFIVAHELAHFIEEKMRNPNTKIIVATRDHEEDYSNNIDEQRKDYIAASLLIPKKDLIKKYKNKFSQSNEFYEKVAKHYRVSAVLAKRRISEVFL